MNIKDIMSSNLITCDKDATLNDVSIKMKNYDIGFIPISDEKKIIGGVLRYCIYNIVWITCWMWLKIR